MHNTHMFYGLPSVGAGVCDSLPVAEPLALPTAEAVMRFSVEAGMPLGKIFPVVGPAKSPAAWNIADAYSYFPALRVDQDYTLAVTNWPWLVDFLRAFKLEHGGQSTFSVTGWAVAANVVTLTFANLTIENQVLAGLDEDRNYRSELRTVTVPALGSSVPAGTYVVTALNKAARTLTFSYTTANASGGAVAVEFHLNRIAGSTTTARWYKMTGASLMTPGDGNGIFILGLCRRGHFQGHRMGILSDNGFAMIGSGYGRGTYGTTSDIDSHPTTGDPVTDGVNGTPRTSPETHGPEMTVIHYLWGRRYLP